MLGVLYRPGKSLHTSANTAVIFTVPIACRSSEVPRIQAFGDSKRSVNHPGPRWYLEVVQQQLLLLRSLAAILTYPAAVGLFACG